jgi:hypothetical protein
MGLLGKLFGGSLAIKKTLEKIYIPQLMEVMDISLPQAQVNFIKLLEQARQESQDLKTANLPENYGDLLLAREERDDKIRAMLDCRRREGVKDEDILWWWNMHDLERRMMLKVDEQRRTTEYLRYRQAGLSKGEAGERVRMFFPTYGDPENMTELSLEDNHLPPELKGRIDSYIDRRMLHDPDAFSEAMERSTTFNALIRREIRKGNL